MKKYIIPIRDEQESKDVQLALLAAGFEWPSGLNEPCYLGSPYIVLNLWGSGIIQHCLSSQLALAHICDNGCKPLVAAWVIQHAAELDGATTPEPPKKMTVAEVAKALGHAVEIVEG